ncbi:unnamed protein product [Brugia timori]|uniref:SOS response associated peptidase (SRAP) n=1 Tax=Brugia timori TaxID=42155 RepID=A0A0R3R081_9BILA|nr:unnamed protein product [Brugia timori]
MTLKVAQVPCHLIRDAHEWINEIPTVPYLLPNEAERAWQTEGKEVTLSKMILGEENDKQIKTNK